MRFDSPRPLLRTLAVWLTVLACTALTAGLVWHGSYGEHTGLRHADSGLPMITAADGFFYLAHAKEEASEAMAPAPLLSRLAHYAANATGLPLEAVAFWLPCVLAAGMACWYAGWARLLRLSTTAAVLAAAAGSLVPAWVERSRMGWFDTDPGIAFLWQGMLWATACLGWPFAYGQNSGQRSLRGGWGESRGGGRRLLALAVLLLCGVVLALWWMPGAALLPLCLLLLAITFPWAHNRRESNIRFTLLAVLLMGGVLGLLLPDAFLPQRLAALRLYALEHARLILGMKEGLIYASIAELDPVKAPVYMRAIGGGMVGGVLALGAVLAFVSTRRAAAVFLLPSLAMLVLGAMGERFLYLAALPLGLAVGCLPETLTRLWEKSPLFSSFGGWSHAPRAALLTRTGGVLLACAALGNMLYFLWGWVPDGHFRHSHDTVAVHLRRASPPGSPVWNWWDDGYFLQARTGLRTLFDGGSQAPDAAFVAARPFVLEDTVLARRWIRFFSLRGVGALAVLERHWGGSESAVAALERVLAAPDAAAAAAVLRELPPLPPELGDAYPWLFPQGRVFLYLSHRVLRLSQWWMPLGQQLSPDRQAVRTHIDPIASEGLAYNTANGELTLPKAIGERGYSTVQGAYLTDVKPLAEPWPDKSGLYLVASLQSPWLYITTGHALHSLPLRLMAPGGAEIEGFTPIAVDYDAAGAWEVLP